MMDDNRYPRTAAYLRGLPHGVGSFPEAQVTAESFAAFRKEYGARLADPSLPEPLGAFLDGSNRASWLSEAVANGAMWLARDQLFADDEAFLEWAYQDSSLVFHRPLYRALMFVLSPALVVMGAAKRWSAFHRGSTLHATPVVRRGANLETTATLVHPPGLFSGLILARQAQAFKAALDCAKARNAAVEFAVESDKQASFQARWQA